MSRVTFTDLVKGAYRGKGKRTGTPGNYVYNYDEPKDRGKAEGQEFVEEKSPLSYRRASHIQRLSLRDDSIEPPYRDDFGFADQYTYRNPRTGRMTKKRHLEAPGAGDDVVGFLDYHNKGETSEGKPFLYIDYMKTRREHTEQGVATRLLEEFINRYAPEPGSVVHFGKIQNPGMWSLYEKIKEKYPKHLIMGAKNFV